MTVHAKTAFVAGKWLKNVRVTCAESMIRDVAQGSSPLSGDICVDVLMPSLGNLHSHTFQRAMAGMTEFRAAGQENFWTWRELMYRFLGHLTPEQIQAIAAMAFLEMQEAGFASVTEFHYVHHRPDGMAYERLAELSERIFAAANESGIGLTHLPVLYTYAGVNKEALAGGQLRFSNDVDRYLRLVDDCRAAVKDLHDDTRIGIAPHSLRATSPSDLSQLLTAVPNGPIHIHISEQLKEVADVRAKLGLRPVEWLLDNADVDKRWCLIHATHMTEEETIAMARSGAVAGLCPITEANLGDGIFNGPTYLNHDGKFGVGSDSNIRISLTEELRMLEYSQRLRDKERNVMVVGEGSVGETLYTGAAEGGAQASARNTGTIAPGKLADLVAIDRTHPTLCALKDEQLLDGLCFAAPDMVVTDTWSAGRHMVQSGRHIARDAIIGRYRTAVGQLLQAI